MCVAQYVSIAPTAVGRVIEGVNWIKPTSYIFCQTSALDEVWDSSREVPQSNYVRINTPAVTSVVIGVRLCVCCVHYEVRNEILLAVITTVSTQTSPLMP